jgi:hypothetical protein
MDSQRCIHGGSLARVACYALVRMRKDSQLASAIQPPSTGSAMPFTKPLCSAPQWIAG